MRTPDVYAFALLAQGAEQPAGTGQLPEVQTDFFQLLTQGGLIAEAVLVLLLIFSAISWAVILYKFWQYSRAGRHTDRELPRCLPQEQQVLRSTGSLSLTA